MAVYSINAQNDLHNADVSLKNYVLDQPFNYQVYQHDLIFMLQQDNERAKLPNNVLFNQTPLESHSVCGCNVYQNK
jgi:hypothetical protein